MNETKPERDNRPSVMGRPVERTGSYRRITLEVREDLLANMDRRQESRRELIERLLENEFSAVS